MSKVSSALPLLCSHDMMLCRYLLTDRLLLQRPLPLADMLCLVHLLSLLPVDRQTATGGQRTSVLQQHAVSIAQVTAGAY